MEFVYEKVTKMTERGEFVPLKDFRAILPYDKDLYRSYYGYCENELLEWLASGKSFSDFNGVRSLPEVVLDIDAHNEDYSTALATVQEIVYTLTVGNDVPEENIIVWFSGGGFHIGMPSALFGEAFAPSVDLPRIVRNTLLTAFPKCDNIYDHSRIIRVGKTFNSKRGRWKIPVPLSMIYDTDIDGIIASASSIEGKYVEYTTKVSDPCLENFVRPVVEALVPAGERVELPDKGLTNIVTCMHSLYLRGPVRGRRHTDMLRMVSHWRRQHIPFEVCVDMARNWLRGEDFNDKEIVRLVQTVYDKDYRYGCEDVVRLEFCNPKCIFYVKKNEGSLVMSPQEMHRNYQEIMADEAHQNPINLDKYYNLGAEFNIYPAEMVVVIGDTGLNKTALMQNLAILAKPRRVTYISTEMSKGLLYRRFIQIASGMSKTEINQYYKAKEDPPGLKHIDHISMTDTALDIQKIYKHLLDSKPQVLIVDVIEDIGDDKDSNRRIELAAIGLNWLAKTLGIVVFVVSHISKAASGVKLSVDSSKGPKALIQKADKLIGIEGFADDPLGYRDVRSIKARDEKPFKIKMKFDNVTFRMKQTYEDNDEK